MKRNLAILLCAFLCVTVCLTVTAQAKTYSPGETDLTISVDDTAWYVFTRDNIENNPELDELGISYEKIHEILYSNDAYMDAILYYEDGNYVELFIRKKTVDSGIANLSKYDDDEVMELAKELAKKVGAENYSIYENNYKYAKLDYEDPTYGYYICEYVTVVNREAYTFTFQATAAYTDYEYEEIKKIVDSVRFDVDTSLKEKGKEKESIWGDVVIKALSGAAIGGTVGAVVGIVSKKKKDKNAPKNDQEIPVNTTEIQE